MGSFKLILGCLLVLWGCFKVLTSRELNGECSADEKEATLSSPPWRASHRARWWWIGCCTVRTCEGEETEVLTYQVGPVKGPLVFFVADHLVKYWETSIDKTVCNRKCLSAPFVILSLNVTRFQCLQKEFEKASILATPMVLTFAPGNED